MNLFDSVRSYGCRQAYLGTPKVFPNIESTVCQVCYDVDFLYKGKQTFTTGTD